MRRKGIAVLVSALMLAVSLTGCGKQEVLDGTETAATLDDTTSMTLGEFNLMLRYQEAQMERLTMVPCSELRIFMPRI